MSAREGVQITVRVDPRLVERADALIDFVAKASGRPATRADAWREALVRGLLALEAEAGEPGTPDVPW